MAQIQQIEQINKYSFSTAFCKYDVYTENIQQNQMKLLKKKDKRLSSNKIKNDLQQRFRSSLQVNKKKVFKILQINQTNRKIH